MYWIEVASGNFTLEKKLKGEKGLYAPKSTKYQNLMSKIKTGDKIIHYLTTSLTSREYISSFVAVSNAASEMTATEYRYEIALEGVRLLNRPVRLRELKENNSKKSKELEHAIKMCMQSYLFEINKEDYDLILSLSKIKKTE